MKIFFSPYTRDEREGALLRVEFEDSIGYSDLHPWTKFGDPPLKEHLEHWTDLLKIAVDAAKIDAAARKEGRSLFDGQTIPESHLLVTSLSDLALAKEEGFQAVKWKITPDSPFEEFLSLVERLHLHVRLDANGSFTEEGFMKLLKKPLPWNLVEFVEDPYPASPSWDHLPIPVASDWLECPYGSYRILKPLQRGALPDRRIPIVTGSLGHPLGDAFAAYIAASQGSPNHLHALLGYRSSPFPAFTEQLTLKGPRFASPGGTGIGFDDLLAKIAWKPYDGPK